MIMGCGPIQLLGLEGRTKYFTLGQMATKLIFKLAGGDILNDPCEVRKKNPGCQRGSGRNSGALRPPTVWRYPVECYILI